MAAASTKPFSIAFGPKGTKQPPPPTHSKKRPHSALADADSDTEAVSAQPQVVTGFDQSAGGAISITDTPKIQLPVIPYLKNRDWKEEVRRKRRRGRNFLPTEVRATNGFDLNGTTERDEVSKEAGLKFVVQRTEDGEPMSNGQSETHISNTEDSEPQQTADEQALEALMGKEKRSTLVIPATVNIEDHDQSGQAIAEEYMNEDDRFKADVASRPDVASAEDYERVPVEDFGAAMLRGMGWKEGDVVGKAREKAGKPRLVERRPALLGIGAKETPGGLGDELGSWGKVAKGRRKADLTYNPVLLKNSQTGEMVTEEDLEERKKHRRRDEGGGSQREEGGRNHRDEGGRNHRDASGKTYREEGGRGRREEGRRSHRDEGGRSRRDREYERDRDYRRR